MAYGGGVLSWGGHAGRLAWFWPIQCVEMGVDAGALIAAFETTY